MAHSTTKRIPAGDLGTLATIREMRRVVDRGVRDPLTHQVASFVVSGVLEHGPPAIVGAIRGWLDSRIVFQADPVGVEMLREVREMLLEIARNGQAQVDCDDISTLGAALAKTVGIPARFTVLAFPPRNRFQHVYAELFDGRYWRDLDITKPPSALRPSRVMNMRV